MEETEAGVFRHPCSGVFFLGGKDCTRMLYRCGMLSDQHAPSCGRQELTVPLFLFLIPLTNTKSCFVALVYNCLVPSASSFRLDHWEGRRGCVKRAWVGSCQMAELSIVFNYVAKLPRQLGSHQPCRVSGEECHTHINVTSRVVLGVHAHSRSILRFVRACRLQDVTGEVKPCTEGPSALFFY